MFMSDLSHLTIAVKIIYLRLLIHYIYDHWQKKWSHDILVVMVTALLHE